jgi:hypothetical protein
VVGGTKSRQISPDGKWWWDGVSWRPIAPESPLVVLKRVFDWAVVGTLYWVLFPIALAVVMAIVTPTYWGSMFSTRAGIGLLGAGLLAIAIGGAPALIARKVARPSRGSLLAGVAILLVAFLIQFFTLWVVLLGPALIILLSPSQT